MGNWFDFFGSALQTADQGYLMTGTGIGLGSYQINLVKVDTSGIVQWAKNYHSGNWLFPYADEYGVSKVIATSDGGYMLCGSREADFFLMKTDVSGNISWAKSYDKAGGDTLYSVKQTSDGGYIAVGQTRLSTNDSLDAYILKVNASGTYQWGATWKNNLVNSNDILYDVVEDPGIGYIAVGYLSEVFNGGNDTTTDILVLKTDLNGNLTFGKAFGEDTDNEEAHYILRDGSNYYLTGHTENGAFGTDIFFLQMDNSGTISAVHSYNYGLTDMGGKVIKKTNGDFVLFGMDPFSFNIFMVTVNASGTFQSGYDYTGNFSFPIAVDGQQTADGGLMLGTMAGNYDYYLIKTDPTGSSGCYENSLSLGTTTLSFTSTNADNSYTTGGLEGSPSVSVDNFTLDTTIVDCAVIPCDTPTVSISPTNPDICSGDSQTLIASGSNSSGSCDSYSWNTGDNTASITVSPASQTTYTVTGYVGVCPSNPVSVTVNVYPTPTPSISGNSTVCENSTGEVYTTTNVSGNTYTWTVTGGTIVSGNGTNSISVNWGSTSGTVSVTENNSNCSASDNFSVTIVPAPTVNAGADDSVCEGNSITLTGTASNYSSLLWTTSGDGTFSASTSLSTDYTPGTNDVTTATVTITLTANGNGTCGSISDDLILTVIANATVDAGTDDEICAGETYQLNGTGTNYTTIAWITSGSGTFSDASILNPVYTPSAADISAGSVTLTVSATNNPQCNPATDNMMLTINPIPNVIAGSSAAACEGVDINLTETGGEATSWSWTGPAGFSSLSQNPTVSSPDASASGWYIVTGSFATGCSSTDSVQVTVNPNPTVFIAGDTSLCDGDSSLLTASGADTYLWSTGDTTATITISPAVGQSLYGVTGTNTTTGCSADMPVIVNVYPNPVADAGQDTTICYSNTATLHATGGTTYQWSPTSTLNDYTAQNPYATPLDTTTYYVTVTNDWSCTSVDSVTVNVLEGPSYNIFTYDVQCPNSNDGYAYVGNMNGVNPITYEWDNSSTDTIINNLTAGDYFLTISDGIGCHYYEQVTINEPDAFADSTIVTNIACYGDNTGNISSFVSGGTSPYSFSWNNGGNSQTIGSLSVGYYSATVTDNHNCIYNIDSLHISQPASPVSFTDTSSDANCYAGNEGFAMVNATGGTEPYSYQWSNGDTTNSIAFLTVGTYMVTIQDANNCTTYDTLHISQPTPIVIHAQADSTSCIDGTDGSIQVIVTGGVPPYDYLWSGEAAGNDSVVENLIAGTYYLTITDAQNCESLAEVSVVASPNECLKIPEIISPNDDGHNDTWEIPGIANYNQVTIEIFNRWGNKIFTFDGSGAQYADPANQWDGSFKGRKKLSMQSFIYILDVHNGREPFQGTVTVVD